MRRLLTILVIALSPLASQTATAHAQVTTIPAGVSSGAVDLSGLTAELAAAKLAAAIEPALQGDLVVGAGGRVFKLSAAAAGERLDAALTAKRALRATQPGPVPLALGHTRGAVRDFVARIASTADRPARDAQIKITLLRVYRIDGRDGFRIDEPALRGALDQALDTPGAPRVFHLKLRHVAPRVQRSGLARAYPTVVTIDRAHFRLRLFKRLVLVKSYGVAVGRSGLETPAGIYHVQEREVNPSWHVPNSAWAGALAGTTVPPGPNDPIVARWLGLGGGVGIHGTNEPFSIGSAASHGCIRMLVGDVEALYPRVPLGTPVFIR